MTPASAFSLDAQ
jgi:hypothetical protein